MQGGTLLGFRTDNEMTFFHSQNVLGFKAEIADPEFFSRIREHIPQSLHMGCGHMKFIGQLAHKSKAHGPDRNDITDQKFTVADIWEGFVGDISLGDFLEHLAGVGPRQVDDTEGVRQVHHVKIPAVMPAVIAKPFHRAAGSAGGSG